MPTDRTRPSRPAPTPSGSSPGSARRRGLLWRWRRVGYVAVVLAVVAAGGIWAALNTIDLPEAKRSVETSFVCDIDVPAGQCGFDNSMARLSTAEERVLVDYDDLPPVLVQAVLSAEDRSFFDHNGVDPVGSARAVYQDIAGDSASRQGGATSVSERTASFIDVASSTATAPPPPMATTSTSAISISRNRCRRAPTQGPISTSPGGR